MKALNELSLDKLMGLLPDELISRHQLEDLDEALAIKKAIGLLKARQELGIKEIIGYHTSDRFYKLGNSINPQDSRGKYKGKIFFSKSQETAFKGDNPRYTYIVKVDGKHPDPEDLTGNDWYYTLSPAKILKRL
ncbi:MAG: hypothetical protein U9Q69_02420 [Nanoarchaeota archaeon]|nr:hypothetical protein [Nanoarchaeota archaeon]